MPKTELLSNVLVSRLTAGYRPNEMQRMVNNSFFKPSYAKYLVSLRNKENDGNFGYTHFCGGIIIRKNLVLTAAHCMMRNQQKRPVYSLRVVAKTPTRLTKTINTQIIKVKKIIVHQNFSITKKHFDIALLKLQKSIVLDNKWAATIALPKKRAMDYTMCTVIGWGKLFVHGPLANEVLHLNVTLHSTRFCRKFLIDFGDSKLCANDLHDFEKNPCSGDSGGPLICNGILTGIVSYGNQFCFGEPTVYTDVHAYMKWINRNEAEMMKIMNAYYLLIFSIVVILSNKLLSKY